MSVVNLGSLCIDYVYSVPRLSDAGVTVASTGRRVFPGGKGLNQSIAIARAGGAVKHFGAVGDDGHELLNTLTDEGVDASGVSILDGASGHAFIQVDPEGRNAIVIHGGTNRSISPDLVEASLDATGAGDWLLLQNEINGVDEVINAAVDRGITVALNLAPADERISSYPIERVSLLIVNEEEGAALSGAASADAAYTALVADYPDTTIVLTRGEAGLRCHMPDGLDISLGSFAVSAIDETAAGDAFVGYLMHGLTSGLTPEAALVRASAAGALTVTAAGAAPSIPDAASVSRFLGENSIRPPDDC